MFIELCNACLRGYWACIYARSVDSKGRDRVRYDKVRLLVSITKVAPLKTQSISRLKVLAAVLISKFILKNVIDFDYELVALTDSNVILAWLPSTPQLRTFVSSRVMQIIGAFAPHC